MSLNNIFRPTELYKFAEGKKTWMFASSIKIITYDGDEYLPTNVSRSGFDVTTDTRKSDLSLYFSLENSFAAQFVASAPDQPLLLEAYRVDRGDTSNVTLFWRGRVVGGTVDNGKVTITCESIYSKRKVTGLRGRMERVCRHQLYKTGCFIDEELHKETVEIESVESQRQFTAKEPIEDVYAAGYVVTDSGVQRYITEQDGQIITLSRDIVEVISSGQNITLYKGCTQLEDVCDERFDNSLNFGGFTHISGENPFEGNSF